MMTLQPSRLLAIDTEQPEHFRCEAYSEGILKCLQSRQDLCDVVLIAGSSDKRISAHRVILIAASDYFSGLLSGPMEEKSQWEITLDEANENVLEKLINFCYTGCLEFQGAEIEALLTTAIHLHLRQAVEACVAFVQRHINPSNCLTVVFLAERLKLENLLQNAKEFFYKNFVDVSKHAEFFLLNAKQLSEFIVRDKLCVPNEEFLFCALMNWMDHDPDSRKELCANLLVHVRLHLMHPTFLLEKVEPVCTNRESQKLLHNALKYYTQLSIESNQSRISPKETVMKHLLAIYPSEEGNLVITGYNLHTKEWTKWKTLKQQRSEFAVAVVKNDLLILGGNLKNNNIYDHHYSHYYYNYEYQTGEQLARKVTCVRLRGMNELNTMGELVRSRRNHSVAILNGWIFAIGGKSSEHNKEALLNSVERWNPMFETWSDIAPMEHARCNFAVAVIFEHLYVCGGIARKSLKSMECYDPISNIWKSRAPMKVARSSHCLAAYKGYLFAIGGCDGSNSVTDIERYDPFTDTWTTISYSPGISGYTRCASLGQDVFIYNDCKIFLISSKSSCCENLILEMLPESSQGLMNISRPELLGTAYEIN